MNFLDFPSQFGVGTDIESIVRFEKDRLKDDRFLRRIFTARELDYCFRHKRAAPHLAARFCGKEACIKALYSLKSPSIALNRIEILPDESGCPEVSLLAPGFEAFAIRISLSHCEDKAMASVIIIKGPLAAPWTPQPGETHSPGPPA